MPSRVSRGAKLTFLVLLNSSLTCSAAASESTRTKHAKDTSKQTITFAKIIFASHSLIDSGRRSAWLGKKQVTGPWREDPGWSGSEEPRLPMPFDKLVRIDGRVARDCDVVTERPGARPRVLEFLYFVSRGFLDKEVYSVGTSGVRPTSKA